LLIDILVSYKLLLLNTLVQYCILCMVLWSFWWLVLLWLLHTEWCVDGFVGYYIVIVLCKQRCCNHSPETIFEQKMRKNAWVAGAPPRTPLGELTELPDP